MNDKDSKLIYEGWRSLVSKKWDQNHGARERGFGDHEAEQKHLGDEAAAKELGLDVEKYLRAKEQAEEQGKTIEDVIAGWKSAAGAEARRNDPEVQRRAKEARHEQRVRSGYYKDNNRVPAKDKNGHWIDGGMSREDYEYQQSGDPADHPYNKALNRD